MIRTTAVITQVNNIQIKFALTALLITVSYYQQYCHYQFEVLRDYILGLSRAIAWKF